MQMTECRFRDGLCVCGSRWFERGWVKDRVQLEAGGKLRSVVVGLERSERRSRVQMKIKYVVRKE